MIKRKWVVARRVHCIGGPTGFLPYSVALKAFWTQDGAGRSMNRLRRFYMRVQYFHQGDQMEVRLREPRDDVALNTIGRVAIWVPTIEGYRIPIHPDAVEDYQKSVDRLISKTNSRILKVKTHDWTNGSRR